MSENMPDAVMLPAVLSRLHLRFVSDRKSSAGNWVIGGSASSKLRWMMARAPCCGCHAPPASRVTHVFTALHGMQSRYSDGNSVCASVRPSVCQTRAL